MVILEMLERCPDCAPGLEARARVISTDFWSHLFVAALPILISVVAICVIHLALIQADRRATGRNRNP
jgi:hypothetical protein